MSLKDNLSKLWTKRKDKKISDYELKQRYGRLWKKKPKYKLSRNKINKHYEEKRLHTIRKLFGKDVKLSNQKNEQLIKENVELHKAINQNKGTPYIKLNSQQLRQQYEKGILDQFQKSKQRHDERIKLNNYYEEQQAIVDNDTRSRRLRYIGLILVIFIGIGVALGVINLTQKYNEDQMEYYYTETPIDKLKQSLVIVSESGTELKEFLDTWQDKLAFDDQTVVNLRFIPIVSTFVGLWNMFVKSPIFKITVFVLGGAFEIIKVSIRIIYNLF